MRAETREETRVHQPTSHPPGSASPGQPSPVHSPTRVLVRGAGRRGGTPGRHTNIEQDQGRPGLGRDQRGRGVQHAEHRPVRLPPPRPAPRHALARVGSCRVLLSWRNHSKLSRHCLSAGPGAAQLPAHARRGRVRTRAAGRGEAGQVCRPMGAVQGGGGTVLLPARPALAAPHLISPRTDMCWSQPDSTIARCPALPTLYMMSLLSAPAASVCC